MKGIATRADIEAAEANGIPADLPRNTYEMLQRGAAIAPEAKALSFFLRTDDHAKLESWSYAQLFARITQAANAFHRLGATKDTVIAYVLPNLPETHFVIWGGEAAGIVFAINPLLEPQTMAELLNAAKVSILVTLAPFPKVDLWSKIQSILPQLKSLQHLVLVELADRVQGLKKFAAKLVGKREAFRLHGLGGIRGAVPRNIGVHRFEALLSEQPGDRLVSNRKIDPDDFASFFCTGGTTGLPKIATRRHGQETANAWMASMAVGPSIGPGKTLFCGLPLFHVNAVLATGLFPFYKGAHVILGTPQGYRGEGVVKRFWEIVEQHKIHFFSGVPTLYAALLEVPVGDHKIDSLEYGLCGAAPMPVQVFKDFQQKTGLKILEGYGLTEAICVSSINPPQGEKRIGSIGLRIPGQQMKAGLFDDQGRYLRDCATGEAGSILLSGPNIFDGYLAPEQNKKIFVDTGDGQRWLDTGDLGRQDAEGYFWLTGRKKELIIRGGHNIDPASIEAPLHRHPAVQLAAAIARPDAHAGELPVAYVQLKPGAKATEAELLEFLKSEISERAAMPKAIHIIDAIPLTPVGKIFKPALKRLEIESALKTSLMDSGIEISKLEIADDAAKGIIIKVQLKASAQIPEAEKNLGKYPFAVSIS